MKKKKNENKLTDQVDNLIRELENTGDPKSKDLAERAKRIQLTQEKLNKTLANLSESLDNLRICIKYQVFDLEATRRENEYLKRLLDGSENGELGEK